MASSRPSMFVGSSKEGLAIAKAFQQNLDRECEIAIWCQGVFGLGGGTLETLLNRVKKFDFGVFILTADDITFSRVTEQPSPRDNVLLELGMFLGTLGRERTFIIHEREVDLKLPSDLVGGLTPATFEPHSDGNLQAALGACSTSVENEIRKLGIRSRAEITGAVDIETQYSIISGLMEASDQQFFIIMLEQNLLFKRDTHPFLTGELYELHKENNISSFGGYSFDKLCQKLADADLLSADLRNNISLTSRGKDFASWLIENGKRADYFRCSKGSWGVAPVHSQYDQIKERSEAFEKENLKRMLGSLPLDHNHSSSTKTDK
jgi:hypothetical protein